MSALTRKRTADYTKSPYRYLKANRSKSPRAHKCVQRLWIPKLTIFCADPLCFNSLPTNMHMTAKPSSARKNFYGGFNTRRYIFFNTSLSGFLWLVKILSECRERKLKCQKERPYKTRQLFSKPTHTKEEQYQPRHDALLPRHDHALGESAHFTLSHSFCSRRT